MATMTINADKRQETAIKRCRFCGADLERTFIDLGMSPLCETYPSAADLNQAKSTIRFTSTSARNVSWFSLKNTKGRRISSETTHIFLPIPIRGSSTAENYCNKMIAAAGLTRTVL